MITQGIISDKDDIEQKSFVNGQTGEARVSGVLSILTTKPTQVVTVKVSEDLWKEANNGKFFESLVGKQIDFMLAPKDYSFMRDGQLTTGTNINLFKLPDSPQIK
ncbi:hypothetical protein [Vibrio fluvialis]|uniref:hypothetical protein n=1 Tax=Vibrio fluvialis TaxID=676 RepID=UPI000357E500|nr:hypothetical protein [Vibrio fluvialis]EKO3436333.1 hypothetical protein [Vibrio fluvialis]EPP23590.1 hypothetical protein L911_2101 [Vibrio fluvialis I21563]MBL4259230.1 hypothetical protein [Vibrio fluvialis]MBY7888858.1 hypothetical protein [Vibrio fluvialis]MBY8107397.1 hypothetical protein [Vibrio fluvialis]